MKVFTAVSSVTSVMSQSRSKHLLLFVLILRDDQSLCFFVALVSDFHPSFDYVDSCYFNSTPVAASFRLFFLLVGFCFFIPFELGIM